MSTNTDVTRLKINTLTEAQYDAAVQTGVIGENEISIITDLDEAIQVDTMPTANADELSKVYQFIGTTGTYTHGYFYECVSDGQTPATYSWQQTNVQPAPSGLPSQTGNSGKFLTTDGTDASWNSNVLAVKGAVFTRADINDQALRSTESMWIGYRTGGSANTNYNFCCGIGRTNIRANKALAVGSGVTINSIGGFGIGYYVGCNAIGAMAIGHNISNNGSNSVVINTSNNDIVNNSPNVFKVANANGNFEIMSADGTIPTDRFTTTPVAAGTYSASITVDSQGTVTRSWATAADPLPSQSGQSGKFLTTDGSSASWSNIPDPLPSQTGNAGKVLMTNGTTASWVDMTTTPQTAPVLQGTATYWITDPNTGVISQTINVQGVTASNTVLVGPAPVSAEDYATAGIICTAQGNGTLTFTCQIIPSIDLTLNVVCF